ncbi:MAG: Pr6Pr family membrane protein [Clostridia bacterium]|nr:Pr6Pr family membrane protein [Clostridia bacterium]
MKKTVSQIYRLAFILFYIWATFESIFLSGGGIRNAFSAPALLADTCAFLVVLASFIFSVIGSIPEVLIRIKGAVTAMALLVLVLAFSMFFTPSAPGWILNILLPVMMILDFILFDKKGAFRIYDPLLWLLALALLFALWSFLSGHGFDLSRLADFLGGKEHMLSTLLSTLLAGALMFGLDKLFSGRGGFRSKDLFCWLYRIIFLLLTGWALYKTGGENLLTFFLSLKRFAVLSGFLSFLAIAVILIFCILRFRHANSATPFPRLKGAFTLFAAVTVIGYHFFVKGGTPSETPWLILLYISPIMMIFDWIFFDSKGKFRPYDPLWWASLPALYCVAFLVHKSFFAMYPALSCYSKELFFCGGILSLLAVSYGIYLIDLAMKNK